MLTSHSAHSKSHAVLRRIATVGVSSLALASVAWSPHLRVTPQGDRYQSIHRVSEQYALSQAESEKHFTLKSDGAKLVLQKNSRKAIINGRLVWLNRPVQLVEGVWVVAEQDIKKVIDPLINPNGTLAERGYATVAIDAGHGGSDQGTQGGRKTLEKIMTLDVARRVEKLLERKGVTVYMTRTEDAFMELEDRARQAQQQDADLFVSIHFNAAGNDSARGIETFVLSEPGFPSTSDSAFSRPARVAYKGSPHTESSMILAKNIHDALLDATEAPDRGIRRARFVVLKESRCPSVLIECGFLSNDEEERLILSTGYRDTLAEAVAEGIRGYINKVKMAKVAALEE